MDIKELEEAVDRFFSNTARSRAQTKAGLERISSKIEMCLDTLRDVDEIDMDPEGDEDDAFD